MHTYKHMCTPLNGYHIHIPHLCEKISWDFTEGQTPLQEDIR